MTAARIVRSIMAAAGIAGGAAQAATVCTPGQQCGEPEDICSLAGGTTATCWNACDLEKYPAGDTWLVVNPLTANEDGQDQNMALQLLIEEIQRGNNLEITCENTNGQMVASNHSDWCPLGTACGGRRETGAYGSSGGTAHSMSIPDQRGICVLDVSGPFSRMCKDPCQWSYDFSDFDKGGVDVTKLEVMYADQRAKCPGINWWIVLLIVLIVIAGCLGAVFYIRRNPAAFRRKPMRDPDLDMEVPMAPPPMMEPEPAAGGGAPPMEPPMEPPMMPTKELEIPPPPMQYETSIPGLSAPILSMPTYQTAPAVQTVQMPTQYMQSMPMQQQTFATGAPLQGTFALPQAASQPAVVYQTAVPTSPSASLRTMPAMATQPQQFYQSSSPMATSQPTYYR